MRIDAHQHFWKLSRGDYGWLGPDLAKLYRDFLPADLFPLLEGAGIDHTILVQAAPTLAETRFMLDLSRETSFISGVVGWVDFEDPGAVAAIEALRSDEKLVGLRPMVQDLSDDDWLLMESHEPVFRSMINSRLVFDALVLPRHLSRLIEVVRRNPELFVVIDHGAKPPLHDAVPESWFQEMSQLATFPRVSCKLSGLVTEAGPDWSVDDLKPAVSHLLDSFGSDRIIWGSDWPVLNLASDYTTWVETTEELISELSSAESEKILGLNAERIYLSRFD